MHYRPSVQVSKMYCPLANNK